MENLPKELYEFYWKIKSAVALYEVRFNAIPADLLNEIRNTFDHIARCYVFHNLGHPEQNTALIEQQIYRARGHLERLHLDLYKLFLLNNSDVINKIVQQIEVDLKKVKERPYPLPDVTRFQVWFLKERKIVEDVIISAKKDECVQKSHDEKINLLIAAMMRQEEFIDRLSDEYTAVQPYVKEAVNILKKDRWRYRITAYVIPAITLIAGYILGRWF